MCDEAHIGDKYRRTRVKTEPWRDGPIGPLTAASTVSDSDCAVSGAG